MQQKTTQTGKLLQTRGHACLCWYLTCMCLIFFAGCERTRDIALYFSEQNALGLVREIRTLPSDSIEKNAVQALIAGPASDNLYVTIPPDTRLLELHVQDTTASVDFSEEFITTHWGGSTGETLTVYSIVNTLCALDGIEAVRILVEGEALETLAGHMELSRPLHYQSRMVITE